MVLLIAAALAGTHRLDVSIKEAPVEDRTPAEEWLRGVDWAACGAPELPHLDLEFEVRRGSVQSAEASVYGLDEEIAACLARVMVDAPEKELKKGIYKGCAVWRTPEADHALALNRAYEDNGFYYGDSPQVRIGAAPFQVETPVLLWLETLDLAACPDTNGMHFPQFVVQDGEFTELYLMPGRFGRNVDCVLDLIRGSDVSGLHDGHHGFGWEFPESDLPPDGPPAPGVEVLVPVDDWVATMNGACTGTEAMHVEVQVASGQVVSATSEDACLGAAAEGSTPTGVLDGPYLLEFLPHHDDALSGHVLRYSPATNAAVDAAVREWEQSRDAVEPAVAMGGLAATAQLEGGLGSSKVDRWLAQVGSACTLPELRVIEVDVADGRVAMVRGDEPCLVEAAYDHLELRIPAGTWVLEFTPDGGAQVRARPLPQ